MFADVVGEVSANGWTIEEIQESPDRALGVNTPADLLELACGLPARRFGGHAELGPMCSVLADDCGLDTSGLETVPALSSAVRDHHGPVSFLRRWDAQWA